MIVLPLRICAETEASLLGADKSAFENAKAAAVIALEALNLVATLGENVPYLGAIATALTAFKRVMGVRRLSRAVDYLRLNNCCATQEVDACKEDCRAAMKEAEAFENLLYEFKAKWGYVESNGKDALQQAFWDAGKYVHLLHRDKCCMQCSWSLPALFSVV